MLVQDSALRVEMLNLEEQADNAKARELFWKPLSWLGAIRCLRPSALGDVCLHDARFGGPHPCRPLTPP